MQSDFPEKEKKIKILKDFVKSNPEPRELRRAIAVKLALEGYPYRGIQKILEVSVGFISKWNKAFKFGGLEALKSRDQGARGYLNRSENVINLGWSELP